MFYTESQLGQLGLKSFGKNVLISDKASLHGCSRIEIGNNVRIDDFCILSAGEGGIIIGNNVHIATFASIVGKNTIKFCDFSGISSRVSIFSSSDDYSGKHMTNPTVPDKYKNVHHGDVILEKHVIIGCGAVILPGVTIGEGTAIGAMTLIHKNCKPHKIYHGVPARAIKDRDKGIYEYEKQYMADMI